MNRLGKTLLLFIVGLSLVGCKKAKLDLPIPVYEDYENGFKYQKVEQLKTSDVDEDIRDIELESNEDYKVEYKKIKATSSYEDLCTMGVNNEILYPGAIVDIKDGNYSSIFLDRAPLTISANLETVTDLTAPLSKIIDNPNLSSVREGIRSIVSTNIKSGTKLPSKISLEIKEISSDKEFMMNLGFGVNYGKLNIADNFSYENIKKQTNLAVVLKQVYYTVDVDYSGIKGFFKNNVSNDAINKAFKGTIPAYVSSVSYGRIAIISIQTNYSKEEVSNLINASFNNHNVILSNELDSSLKYLSADKDTTINYFTYGGESNINDAVTAVTTSSMDALSKLFESFNADSMVGLPVSYTMRHLQEQGNPLAKIQSCDEYVVKNVTYNPKKIMNWSFLTKLIENGTIFQNEELKLDFSSMVDYSNPEQTPINANKTITIPENIIDLWLIGPNNATKSITFNNLSINVAYRKTNNPLTIHLKNISFNGDSNEKEANGIAINAESDSKVILDIDGYVTINGIDNHGIKAQNLDIEGSGLLFINGGNGSDAINVTKELNIDIDGKIECKGGNGYSTTNGGNAITAKKTNIKFTQDSSFIGGNGANGVNFETINNGTNGGNSFVCEELNLGAGTYMITAGSGGNGGAGISYDRTANENGKNCDGRDGGNGGNGGNSGKLFVCTRLTLLDDAGYDFNMFEGNSGNGGNGGDGEYAGFQGNNDQAGSGGNGGNGGICYGLDLTSFVGPTAAITGKIISGTYGSGGNGGNGGHADLEKVIVVVHQSFPGEGGFGGKVGYKQQASSYSFYPKLNVQITPNTASDGQNGEAGNGDYYK